MHHHENEFEVATREGTAEILGARGSTPPLCRQSQFRHNTLAIEIRTAQNDCVIFDGGQRNPRTSLGALTA